MPAVATVGLFDASSGFDADRLLAGVTASERERYRSHNRPARAQQYLASRWLLRAHLGAELGLEAADIPLNTTADSPPALPGTRYRLGLSHSGTLCLCIASSRARVGCDAERHRPRRHLQAIAAQYFHPDEAAHLQATGNERLLRDFYRLWTLKEAAQKALGRGIAGGLRAPAFALEPTLRCLAAPTNEPWTLAASELGGYSIAAAIAGAAPPAAFEVTAYAATAEGTIKRRRRIHWDIAATGD